MFSTRYKIRSLRYTILSKIQNPILSKYEKERRTLVFKKLYNNDFHYSSAQLTSTFFYNRDRSFVNSRQLGLFQSLKLQF